MSISEAIHQECFDLMLKELTASAVWLVGGTEFKRTDNLHFMQDAPLIMKLDASEDAGLRADEAAGKHGIVLQIYVYYKGKLMGMKEDKLYQSGFTKTGEMAMGVNYEINFNNSKAY